MRGWTGKTTGSASETAASCAIASASSGPSTSAGRCSVTTRYSPRGRPCSSGAPYPSIRSRIATSVSIIVLPTSWIPAAGQPSASRLSRASGEWMKRSCESWSATIRLISSGIVRSNERRPASTCPIGSEQLRGGQRGGQRRVDVAGNEHDVGLGLEQHRLEALHDRGRLLRVRAGADAERVVGLADAELLEEDLGHLAVVVLARVDEHVLELVAPPAELRGDRRDLHHVRPRPDDGQDFSAPGHRA